MKLTLALMSSLCCLAWNLQAESPSPLLTDFTPGVAEAPDAVERESSRPDLEILCYPVITLGANTHQGSGNNLLGPNPPGELISVK